MDDPLIPTILIPMRTMGFWSRSLSGVLALWFGMVMAAPAILHACPRALAAESNTDAHAAHEHHHHPGSQDTGAPKECRCLGTCAVSTAAVLTPSTPIPVAILTPVFVSVLPQAAAQSFRPLPDHSRPFATAPPLRAA
jgi:hypothetical protein